MSSPPNTIDCDVLVTGGGINGAGIARDATGRGLSVTLCEKDDIASHTSSASSKLIHGGVRYLEQYEFGLAGKLPVQDMGQQIANGQFAAEVEYWMQHEWASCAQDMW